MSWLKSRKRLVRVGFVLLLLSLAAFLVACQGTAGPEGKEGPQGRQGVAGPPGAPAPLPPGPGLKLTITKVDIPADRKPVVTFTLTDDSEVPLDPTKMEGFQFILSKVAVDPETKYTQYVSYITRQAKGAPYTFDGKTVPPVLASVQQPYHDAGGTFTTVDAAKGVYTYTANVTLPNDYDKKATHVAAFSFSREGRAYIGVDTYSFVPAGGAVTTTRLIATNDTCNTCHKDLALHGGTRRGVEMCVLCHNPGNIDPETGNTPDLKVMVHKIHNGANLPSVKEGKPYYIVGYRQTVVDFSKIQWPQDVRNCTTCHNGPDGDNYKLAPNRAACGSCHDDVDFASGKNHPGGAQANDKACSSCHGAESGSAPIVEKHKIPPIAFKNIVELTMTPPANGQFYVAGEKPKLTIVIKDANTGKAINPNTIVEPKVSTNVTASEWRRANLFVSGPRARTLPVLTTAATEVDPAHSYANNDLRVLNDPEKADPNLTRSASAITYQLGDVKDLKRGTYTAFVEVMPSAPLGGIAFINFQVGTKTPDKTIATNCTTCHNDARMHAAYFAVPFNPDICKSCHDYERQMTGKVGWTQSNWGFGAAPLARRVHGVHFGAELDKPKEVHAGVDYSHVEFPQDVRNCTTCHSETTTWQEKPSRLACLACHDSDTAISHGLLMTVDATPTDPWSGDEIETCKTCHGAGREFSPDKVHQR